MMTVIVDTREKARAIRKILKTFDRCGIPHVSSKLWVGDYARLDNQLTVIDRKQNLNELAGNICEQRFHDEVKRAYAHGVKIVFLVEHGDSIKELIDVLFWENPRRKESPKCINGDHLYKSMISMSERYGVEWKFCTKEETGHRIMEILDL